MAKDLIKNEIGYLTDKGKVTFWFDSGNEELNERLLERLTIMGRDTYMEGSYVTFYLNVFEIGVDKLMQAYILACGHHPDKEGLYSYITGRNQHLFPIKELRVKLEYNYDDHAPYLKSLLESSNMETGERFRDIMVNDDCLCCSIVDWEALNTLVSLNQQMTLDLYNREFGNTYTAEHGIQQEQSSMPCPVTCIGQQLLLASLYRNLAEFLKSLLKLK